MPTLRTLIVEDRPDDAELLVAELSRGGYTPQWTRVDTLGDLIARVQDDAPDVVITDYSLPGMDALDVLRTIRDLDAQIPVIVVSGVMDELTCVESLRLGAADYLLKDRLARLAVAVDQALTRHRLEQEARRARQEERLAMGMLQGLVANAPAAICLQAIDGQYLLSNPSYDRLEGLARTSDRGARVTASVPQAVEYHEEVVGDRTFLSVRYRWSTRPARCSPPARSTSTSPGRSGSRRTCGPPGRSCRRGRTTSTPATCSCRNWPT
jgi:DNA-binding response OmpR family regulator